MAKCCFDKVSLKNTFAPKWPYATELYARLLYIEAQNTKVLIAAFDTLCTSPSETERFRKGVSACTSIPADHIWYHELQVHAAPDSLDLRGETMDRIITLVSAKANEMSQSAVDFTWNVAQLDAGDRFTMNREQYIPGLGGVTVWAGIKFDSNGRAYCNDPSTMLLRGYHPDIEAFNSPIYFDNPVDPKAYLFVFRNMNGQIIGTLSRFAAHPDVAVLFELRSVPHADQYHYHFDWTGYLTEKLEHHFSAPSIYLNGPCADLAARKGWDGMDTFAAADQECKRIGEEIADALISEYDHKPLSAGDPDLFKAALFTFELPVRNDFPKSRKMLLKQAAQLTEMDLEIETAISKDRPASEIKALIDLRWRVAQDAVAVDSYLIFDDKTLGSSQLKVTVTALQMGDFLFVGVPGECLVDMSIWLRSSFTGAKTIPVDQVNGYYNYMATPASLNHGGYTYWSSWTSRDSIPVLKKGIIQEFEKWLN